MLGDLSGALTNWIQAFNSAGGANPTYIPGEPVQRTWRQREYHGYFKDDWKVSRKVTLNLGIRYDFAGITPGPHGWDTWQKNLIDFAPRLFRTEVG